MSVGIENKGKIKIGYGLGSSYGRGCWFRHSGLLRLLITGKGQNCHKKHKD